MNQNQITDLWQKIIDTGVDTGDRTGTGTRSIFGGLLEFDLRERFPLLTIKKTHWRTAFIEMLWFLRGEPNTDYLKSHGVNIWDDWADENGHVGDIYGVQWRHWKKTELKRSSGDTVQHADGSVTHFDSTVTSTTTDQVARVINCLQNNPHDRRMIVTGWNVAELDQMSLAPCHHTHQLYTTPDGYVDLLLQLRSSDVGLGLPFNVAQYALLLNLYARAGGLKPRHLKICYGNAHIYNNQFDKLKEILATREEIPCDTQLIFKTDNVDIDGYKPDDFDIVDYQCHPFVKLDIAI